MSICARIASTAPGWSPRRIVNGVAGLIEKFFELRMLRLQGERLADIVLTRPEAEAPPRPEAAAEVLRTQVGATITHRVLARLFEDRGVILDRTYQLNVGGNMDFMNMLERERLESKKISKTQSVTSQLRDEIAPRNVHIGPSDYVAWLDDRKWAFVRLEGRAFGNVPLNLEYKLEVWDSPNSAGVIIDAVRACKIALDRKIGGPVLSASSYFMKSPPVQYTDDEAKQAVEDFISGKIEDRKSVV